MSTVLTLVASAIFLIAWALYNQGLIRGKSKPSIVAWVVFSFITLVNSSSYLSLSGTWVKTAVALTDCFVCISTSVLILVLLRPAWEDIDFWDRMAFVAGIVSIAAWAISGSPTVANVLIQSGYFFGMVPTARNAWKNSANEPALPWFIWSSAFVLSILVVVIEWAGNPWELINPIVCLVEHAGVGFIALGFGARQSKVRM